MDATERKQVSETFREVLTRNRTEEVGPMLLASGWQDLVEAEPVIAPAILFEEKGRLLSSAAVLPFALTGQLEVEPTELRVVVPAGVEEAARVDGFYSGTSTPSTWLLLPAFGVGASAPVRLVGSDAGSLRHTAVQGIDPAYGLTQVQGAWPDSAARELDADQSDAIVGAIARAIAQEHLGVLAEMLRIAVVHVKEREQFGRSLASFQAVKHQLSRAHVAIAGARSILQEAWVLGDDSVLAAAALASAQAAGEVTRRVCQQVCGAIGFTMEHPLHTFVRRSLVLGSLWTTVHGATATIGEHLQSTGAVPRLSSVGVATESVFA